MSLLCHLVSLDVIGICLSTEVFHSFGVLLSWAIMTIVVRMSLNVTNYISGLGSIDY